MFQNHKQQGHMFSFITGKVLGVGIHKKIFALYLEHYHEYNNNDDDDVFLLWKSKQQLGFCCVCCA